MDLSIYLKILLKRWWVILLTTLVTVAVVAVLSSRQPKTYTAAAKLRVLPLGQDYGSFVYFDRQVSTYQEIILGEGLIGKVKDELKLPPDGKLPRYNLSLIPQTELMSLTVEDVDREFAMKLSNALADQLIRSNRDQIGESQAVSVLQTRQAELEKQISDATSERARQEQQFPRNEGRIAELNTQIQSRQQSLNQVVNQYNQLVSIQANLASAIIKVQDATLPQDPSGPRTTRDIILGAVVGLLGGLALAFVLDGLSPRLYTHKQIEGLTNASIIGRIPQAARQSLKNIFATNPYIVETFRRLRTNIAAASKNSPARLMLVTSAVPDEGKSFVSSNLATSLARGDQRTVVVDCDLRAPQMHRVFNVSNNIGLSHVLTEQVTLDAAIQDTQLPNLKVIAGGEYVPNSAELFDSSTMQMLMGQLLADFDMVLLDGPALLAVTDSAVLAPCVGAVLMVVDQQNGRQRALNAAMTQLKEVNANVIGTVINRVPDDGGYRQFSRYSRRRKAQAKA